MKDFQPFPRLDDEERRSGDGRTRFSQEQHSEDDFVPSSSLSELCRQFFQKRYLCVWVLAALVPFILLRVLVFYDSTFEVEMPAAAPASLLASDSRYAPPADPDRQERIVHRGDQIRPDEDAWRTHDDFIEAAGEGPRVKRRKNPWFPRWRIGGVKPSDPAEGQFGEIFGVPEDNVNEEEPNHKKSDEEREESDEKAENGPAKTVGKEKSGEGERREDGKETEFKSGKQGAVVDDVPEKESLGEVKPQQQSEGELDMSKSEKVDEEATKNGENETASSITGKPASKGECDLFDGSWVHDPEEQPLYTNATCRQIQGHQNCMSNGRPDTEYLHWKWKPRGCDLPRFDPQAFLESFKGKAIGFVGDSLARNQMQSLLCLLSMVEKPIEVYQSADDQTVRWLYPQYNVTVAVVWSPYLLNQSTERILGFEKGQSVLYLDVLDERWTSVLLDFDIVVLSCGQWFLRNSVYVKGDEVVGCHGCRQKNLTEIGFEDAYRDAMRLVLDKAAAEFRGIAIVSTFAVDHFEGGQWDSGGVCRREMPLQDAEAAKVVAGFYNDMRAVVISEFERAKNASTSGSSVQFELLDVTRLSSMRADGHPGPYRVKHPFAGQDPTATVQNDCLHWCLPGPADTWNQLLVNVASRHL